MDYCALYKAFFKLILSQFYIIYVLLCLQSPEILNLSITSNTYSTYILNLNFSLLKYSLLNIPIVEYNIATMKGNYIGITQQLCN